jgi:acyl dehydratase
MTGPAIKLALNDRPLEELRPGMTASLDIVVTQEDIRNFSGFTGDLAPVHFDAAIAGSMGYPQPIAFGLMVFARFSGLLGMVLPGPRTVIHTSNFSMKKPVFAGDRLTYVAEITRIVKSVKVVILSLKVIRGEDDVVLVGETQCGFRR